MATGQDFVNAMLNYNVLNPTITYEGDYTFQSFKNDRYNPKKDILLLNSKIDSNGNNMYEKFVQNNFYEPVLLNQLKGLPDGYVYPLLYSTLGTDGKSRAIRFSYFITAMNLTEKTEDIVGCKSTEDVCDKAREWFKLQRRALNDYKRNRLNSEYYHDILVRFSRDRLFVSAYGDINPDQVDDYKKEIDSFITDDMLDLYIERFSSVLITLRYIKEESVNPKDLSISSFTRCFDPDTLLLVTIKSILDNQYHSIKVGGKPDNSLVEVTQYVVTYENMNVKGYNPTIKIYDNAKKKVVDYSLKDLIVEYKKLIEKYGDKFRRIELSDAQVEKLGLAHNPEKLDKFTELLREDEDKVLEANWDFITPGEKEITYDVTKRKQSNNDGKKKVIDEDEILYRRFIFQQTNYIKQIVGKEKFEGYVGYVYENGLVVFEKFYEEGGKIAQIQATYVMNIKNFVEFTKLSKPEILEYIKNTDNPDVIRLYHTKNWANNLNAVINCIEPTIDSQMHVEALNMDKIKERKKQ